MIARNAVSTLLTRRRRIQNKLMKDKRTEKINQHYFISLNNQRFKILKCKIDTEKELLTIKTKIFGQKFPESNNILVSFEEDCNQSFLVSWKGMFKDEKIECWEYTIIK